MLQAMNTGHDGSLTTIHANTPRDGLGRLEVMVGMANANMGIRSIRQQIASAVDLFVQIARFSDGTRRITHITEVVGMEQDIITLQDIFLFEKTGITEAGKVLGRFRATGIRPKFYERLKAVRHHPAAAAVPDGGGDQLMPVGVVVSFVVVFALILLAVSVGLKFFDARRKKQVADMLQTAAGETRSSRVSNLLKEIEPDKPTGFKAHAHVAAVLAACAGADPAGRPELVVHAPAGRHGADGHVRVWASALLVPFLLNGPTTAIVLARWSCGAAPLSLRAAQAQEAAGHAGRAVSRSAGLPGALHARRPRLLHQPGNAGRGDCAIRWGRSSARCSTSRTWARRWISRCATSPSACRCWTCRFFTSSVLLQKQTGGNLSEILSRLAYVIRERFRLKGQVKAASAHGRLTATILTLLPIATMLGLLVVAPGYLQGMAADPDGK